MGKAYVARLVPSHHPHVSSRAVECLPIHHHKRETQKPAAEHAVPLNGGAWRPDKHLLRPTT